MESSRPFHVAVPVHDLEKARRFYKEILACPEGRSSDKWIDFNLYGHQFVVHLKAGADKDNQLHFNQVDGQGVPVPHYGVVLSMEEWTSLADRLKKADISFVIDPYIRFEGQAGEQATMFFFRSLGKCP